MKFSQLKCFDKDNKRVYDVLRLNMDTATVRVVAIKVSGGQHIIKEIPFDSVEMVSYTGKLDQAGKGIFEGDKIIYNEDVFAKTAPSGEVYWDTRRLMWCITNDMKFIIGLGEIDSKFIKVIGSKYGGYYSGN